MAGTPPCELHAQLDIPLPAELSVGAGTALFVCGTCFHPEREIADLRLRIDGQEQPLRAYGMPRLDLFRSKHPTLDVFALGEIDRDPASEEDPGLHSYRSGFWGLAALDPRPPGTTRIELVARLDDGSTVSHALAEVRCVDSSRRLAAPDTPAPAAVTGGPLVAVCMATHEPPMDLFRAQIQSIRDQTHPHWVCVISDDSSRPDRFAEIQASVGDDPRFIVSRSPRRLGFFSNFERALTLAPADAQFVAMADQDDRWYPDKLQRLLEGIGDAELIYSDARLTDPRGQVLAETYWGQRRNNHRDLLSVLVANSITGAASLLRAEVLDDALPFPPAQFAHFHDHWVGLVALARGEVRFLNTPLYDYVQHGQAALGHAAANRMPALRGRLASLRADPRDRVRMWRLHYFVDVARLQQEATILLKRIGPRMAPDKAAALDTFLAAEKSPLALGRLWGRGLRELLGRPETLGAEWMLAYALSWRRLLSASARARPNRRLRLDAVPPPDLVLSPGVQQADHPAVRELAAKIQPLALAVSDHAPRRVNLLIPTVDLNHFFGGYIAKFNLARRLAEAGHQVRLVTVDPVGPLPGGWRSRVERYAGLAGVFDQVELAFGRETHALEVSREDAFIATTWWTAHIAHAAVTELGRVGFLYLIQEYEPFTFPMGSYAALAAESYALPHTALFSTELLREYFRRHRLGVFAPGPRAGERRSASFENAITQVSPPPAEELAARRPRRLLFYARPETHASRNMFELGVLALMRAVAQGALSGWELNGIGTIGARRRMSLGGGAELSMLPRADQAAYAELLRGHDVGLALMYTPHPSLVPIEMASAGQLAVTNSFENKTPEAMRQISANLLVATPSVDAIAAALGQAAGSAEDAAARVQGAAVAWSRSWEQSFAPELVRRVADLLEG